LVETRGVLFWLLLSNARRRSSTVTNQH